MQAGTFDGQAIKVIQVVEEHVLAVFEHDVQPNGAYAPVLLIPKDKATLAATPALAKDSTTPARHGACTA